MTKKLQWTKAIKNPYAARLKQQITIRIDGPTIEYFKNMAEETGIPYQSLINLFLRDCAEKRKRPDVKWKAVG